MPEKKVNPKVQGKLDEAQKDFDRFNNQVKKLAKEDCINDNPVQEVEPQTKISSRELKFADAKEITPSITIWPPVMPGEEPHKFNEKFRKKWEFQKERVTFIAENIEIPGDVIKFWTKPFKGVPAQFWEVPVNVKVVALRFVAERIEGCKYDVSIIDESQFTDESKDIKYFGRIVKKEKKERVTARPVRSDKFASSF